MTVSARLDSYLNAHEIPFQTIKHQHTNSSVGTAIAAKVPIEKIAKAVVLTDSQGEKLMAVLPANHKISLHALNEELESNYKLVKEEEVYRMFNDCDHGAVPPVAKAYNMRTVCEPALDRLDDVYLEAGDHETLLHLDHDNFERLIANSKRCHFSWQATD